VVRSLTNGEYMPSTNLPEPEPIKLASILKKIVEEKTLTPNSAVKQTKRHIVVIKDKEEILVEIDAKNVFADTKKKLAGATPDSLQRLKRGLEKEIQQHPNSYDANEFKEMLKAINELLESKR
jgi:hypothetical protein